MSVVVGLDQLVETGFEKLKGKSIGLLCNQATISSDRTHILEHLLPLHQTGSLKIHAVFGPQHGLFGHTQDNMIEWESGGLDERTGLNIFSLYGENRKPTSKMLEGIDLMVVDLPDIGSRYYTFAWTMSLTIQACGELSIPVLVLDRPNPINGVDTEGPILDPSLSSFVGLLPVRARHGMTLGEIARLARDSFNIKSPVEVIQTENWDRNDYLEQTGAPWMLPSPNMPTVDTAVVYPGACLIEATNLSEGRGTSRPFEIIGAPFLDGWKIATALNSLALPGVHFQPIQFMPTFNKHEGILCEGVFVHVLERRVFKPWITYVAIIQESIRQTGLHKSLPALAETFIANSEETRLPGFAWKLPPYEYEFNNAPIDILLGVHGLSNQIENLVALSDIEERSQYS